MTLTMALAKCQKFTANIYDKSRCKNCYKPKEIHSEAALESNKAARKISKCGYMFVAPETFDFTGPLDKTRRWQRRFFVLYDDGELTYSVDENINTVPQGAIDMNQCVDVYDAENVTSHAGSIAVATADKVTYIKGAAKEEINRWHDVLVMYPRSTKTKHKRSPTFPQTKSTSLDQSHAPSLTTQGLDAPDAASLSSAEDLNQQRFQNKASRSQSKNSPHDFSAMNGDSRSRARVGASGRSMSVGSSIPATTGPTRHGEVLSASSVTNATTSAATCKAQSEQPHPLTYRGVRSLKHKHDKSYTEGLRKSNSMHDLGSPPGSPNGEGLSESRFRSHSRENLSGSFSGELDQDGRLRAGIRQEPPTSTPIRTLPAWNSPRSQSRAVSQAEAGGTIFRSRSPTTSLLMNGHNKNETDERKMAQSDFSSSSHVSDDSQSMENSQGRVAIGTTDDSPGSSSFQQDFDYMKKGWLVKQGGTERDWKKFWFVLSGSTLKYYDNMEAERIGTSEGTINLALCYDMSEVNVSRKYGFKLKTRHGDHILSALTLGIRKNWMQAITQCIQSNSGSLRSSSVSPREPSPQNPRRSGERYHTHSGAFSSPIRDLPDSTQQPVSQLERGHSETSNGLTHTFNTKHRLELKAEPPKFIVRRSGSEEMSVTTPTGSTETVRMRSRRRTTDNVAKLPESTLLSPTKSALRAGCTWPYVSPESSNQSQKSSESPRTQSPRTNNDPIRRDLSQYLDGDEKQRPLTQTEEEELDNVQRNVRNIHRKSLTETTQQSKPRHFDKFETGSAYSGSSERQPSIDRLISSRESSLSPARLSSRDSSSQSSPSRPRVQSFDKTLNDPSPVRSPTTRRAPSAKIKEKTKVKTGRVKSPPPESQETTEDFLDTFGKASTDKAQNDSFVAKGPSDSLDAVWKDMEKSSERILGTSTGNGDALVDLLEAEVESLKAQLERTNQQNINLQNANSEMRMELRLKKRHQSEYMNDVELDQTRFMSQLEDYHSEMEQASELFQNKFVETELTERQVEELQAQLNEANSKMQIQEDELKSLQAKLRVSMSELSNLEQCLADSARDLREEQEASQKIIEDLEQQIEDLEKHVEDGDSKIKNQDREIDLHLEKIHLLELDLQEKRRQAEAMEVNLRGIESLKEDLAEKGNLAAAMAQEAELLRRQLREQDEVLQRTQRNSADKVQSMENEFYMEKERLQRRADQLQQQIDQISKQTSIADSLNTNMADILKEKDETIAQLEEKVIENEARIEEMSEELNLEVDDNNKLQKDIRAMNEENERLHKQSMQIQSENADLDQAYNGMLDEVRDMGRQLSEKETEKQLLKMDLERVEKNCREIEENKKQLQSILGVKQEELDGKLLSLSAYKAGAQDKDTVLAQVGEDYRSVCDELETAREEIGRLTEQNVKQRGDIESMEKLNNRSLSELDEVRSLYKGVLHALGETENKVSDLEAARKSVDSKLLLAVKDLERAKSDLTKSKTEGDRKSQETERISSANEQLSRELAATEEKHHFEMESKYRELLQSQKLSNELREKMLDTQREIELESQSVLSLTKESLLDRTDSARSSQRSDSSHSDTPQSYDDLKEAHRKLTSEHRNLRKDFQDSVIKNDDKESINLSLKQELKNIHEGYQSQVDSQGAKVQELLAQISNIEKRNAKLERRSRTQEIRGLVDDATQTEGQLQTSDVKTENVQERVQELQNELDLSDSKANQLMKRLLQQRSFEVELDLLHQQLETLEAENKSIKDRLSKDDDVDDNNLAGQLRELRLKVGQSSGLLEDCLTKLSEALVDMDENMMNDSLEASHPSSAKHRIQSALVMMRDAKALLPIKAQGSTGISDDVKLRLFAERLSTEAVVLGEMSYLVRSSSTTQDRQLTDLHTAKAKVTEVTQFMLEHYCEEPRPDTPSDVDLESLSTYAELLSEKMRIQSQMLVAMDDARSFMDENVDVFVTDGKSMQDVAQNSLAKADLSSKLLTLPDHTHGLRTAAGHLLARSDVECALDKLKAAASSRRSSVSHQIPDQETGELRRRLMEDSVTLQQKLSPVIEGKVKDIAKVLIRCDRCSSDGSQRSYLEIFSKELHHITNRYLSVRGVGLGASDADSQTDLLYSDQFSEHLGSIAERETSKVLQDIEFSCVHFSDQSLTHDSSSDRISCESERTSLILQIGFIIAQKSLVQSLSSYLTDSQTAGSADSTSIPTGAKAKGFHTSASTTSLPELFTSSSEQQEYIATMLARGAASRNSLSSFLTNNTAHTNRDVMDSQSWQDQFTSLATQLLDTDIKISKHNGTAPSYTNLVTQEAVAQAQLSYLHYCLKLKHTRSLEDLHIRSESCKIQHQAEQEREVTDMEDQMEDLESQLEEARNQLEVAEHNAKSTIANLQSDLERKENGFRQEVQALKDGYEIRIRSLQSDLDVAVNDLEKLQQEREHDGHQFEESMHFSVQNYEAKIEKLCSEKEREQLGAQRRIVELSDEICELKQYHRKEVEELNCSKLSASVANGIGSDQSLCLTAEDAELVREKSEQVEKLRVQMEDGKRRHVKELQSLRQAIQGDNDTAAQALLSSKIQQLEEQIQNMQHDYEQELSIQKAAHRREMARSVDDVMQLVTSADAKNIHIDEDVVRKKYVKELDRIKAMYDRSFGAMEKSHQKVLMQMRKAHKRELDGLRQEKDQVLGEETRATQAALDAMRKAHEAELQKERNKFLGAISKTFSQRDVESLQQQHEADLDLIQGELKELSEQYSLRCLEKAAMEERLEAQSKALHQSRKRIQDLMACREELNTRIKHEIEKLKRQVFSGATTGSALDAKEAQLQVKVKEAEINQLNDELEIFRDKLSTKTEELEESSNKYQDLHAIHNVAEQRHRRDLEELRRQAQEQSDFENLADDGSMSQESSGRCTPDLPEGIGHSSHWTVINSDIMTSTPFRDVDPTSTKKRTDVLSRELLAKGQSQGVEASPGRKLPSLTPERRTAKKALWRQRQPQRARSNPGMTGSVALTLQKQLSTDHITSPLSFDPSQRPPRIMKSSLSFDLGVDTGDEKL